jgi:hypothetical protein
VALAVVVAYDMYRECLLEAQDFFQLSLEENEMLSFYSF